MRASVVAPVVCALLAAGCAGTGGDIEKFFGGNATNDIQVSSEPPGGQARSSTGQTCTPTPCVLKVPASAEQLVVTVGRQGFLDQPVEVRMIVTGGYGEGTEPQRALHPNPVSVVLEAAPPPPPPPKKKPPPKRRPAARTPAPAR